MAAAVSQWPTRAQAHFNTLRGMVYTTAQDCSAAPIEETLKWGEPAFLTPVTRSGSTIRLGWQRKKPDWFGIYMNCRTSIVHQVQDLFPDAFEYDGTRGLLWPLAASIPIEATDFALRTALTYHRR